MVHARRALSLLLFVVPVVFVTALGYLLVARFKRDAERDLAPLIAAECTRYLGREVRVGAVTLQGRRAYLDDVAIASGRTFRDGPPMASARQVVLDLDLALLLAGQKRTLPVVPHIAVHQPVLRLRRSRTGRWNLQDLFPRRPVRPGPPAVGSVKAYGGILYYHDDGLYHHPERPSAPMTARLVGVNLRLTFLEDNAVRFAGTGTEVTGLARSVRATGTIHRRPGPFVVQVDAADADLTALNRLVSRTHTFTAGRLTGHGVFSGGGAPAPENRMTFLVTARVSGASYVTRRLAGPVRALDGDVTVTPSTVDARLTGVAAGSPFRTEVAVVGLGAGPSVAGWVEARGASLRRALAFARVERRYPQVRGIEVAGTVRAELHGPLDRLWVRASGPVTLKGALPGGIRFPSPTVVRADVVGPVSDMRVGATGRVPLVLYRGYSARDVWFAGAWRGSSAAVDLAGAFGGGRVTARVALSGLRGRARYRAVARVRGVHLAQVPLPETLPGVGVRAGPPGRPGQPRRPAIAGTADVDLIGSGAVSGGMPDGRATVQVSSLNIDGWRVASANARLTASGDTVQVRAIYVSDPAGDAQAWGSYNVRRRTLALEFEADGLDVGRLTAGAAGGPGAAANGPAQPWTGRVFVRDGRIEGPVDNPHVSAVVRAHDVGAGEIGIDLASGTVQGTRERLTVTDGMVYRFPAAAELQGEVIRPLEQDASIELAGTFRRVEVGELLELAGTDAPVLGTAHGGFRLTGALRRPRIDIEPIAVADATVGDLRLDQLTGALAYDREGDGGIWRLRGLLARANGARLTGDATLTSDGRFAVEADLAGLDLARFEPEIAPYAVASGVLSAGGTVVGAFREGRLSGLGGSLRASTDRVVVNGVTLGEMHADIGIADDAFTVRSGMLGDPAAPVVRVNDLAYDRPTGTLRVRGAIENLALETVRRLAAGSPWVAARPEHPVGKWLMQERPEPLGGALSANVDVAVANGTPTVRVDLETRAPLRADGHQVDDIRGSATFADGVLTLDHAVAQVGALVVEGTGTANTRESRVDVGLSGTGVSLDALRSWVPDSPALAAWQGSAARFTARVSGDWHTPDIEVAAEQPEAVWRSPGPEGTRVVRLAAARVSASAFRTADSTGGIRATDATVRVQVEEPAGSARAAATPIEAQVPSLALEFHWRPPAGTPSDTPALMFVKADGPSLPGNLRPYIPENPFVAARLVVPRQQLQPLASLLPASLSEAGGTVQGDLAWSGPLNAPQIQGRLDLKQAEGERFRWAKFTTTLSDLDAALEFRGDVLHVDRFTVRTSPTTQAGKAVAGRSDPITVTGDLALRQGASEEARLRVAAPRVVVIESPIPGLGGGRLVAERLSADLTVGGTLMAPHIVGLVNLRDASFRAPDTVVTESGAVALPVRPSFDIAFTVEDNVRVSTAQVNALVRTEPNAPILVEGSLVSPQVTGMLVVDRGTLTFPTARFNIQRGGEIELRYPYYAGILDARPVYVFGVLVNVTATTRLTTASVNGSVKRYTVFVQATGPINVSGDLALPGGDAGAGASPGLRLAFRSDPPDLAYTQAGLQQRVMGLLGGQEAISELFSRSPDLGRIIGAQFTDILSASLLPGLFERLGLADALGFDELAVEYGRQELFSLRLSRQLAGPLYVSYWQRLSGSGQRVGDLSSWEFKVSYRVREGIQFSWTTDDQRTNAYLLEGVFRF